MSRAVKRNSSGGGVCASVGDRQFGKREREGGAGVRPGYDCGQGLVGKLFAVLWGSIGREEMGAKEEEWRTYHVPQGGLMMDGG